MVFSPSSNIAVKDVPREYKRLIGKAGFENIMTYETTADNLMYNVEYKEKASANPDHRVFSFKNIGEYSGKIKSVCDLVYKSNGVVLIYSQYVYGGIIPNRI